MNLYRDKNAWENLPSPKGKKRIEFANSLKKEKLSEK